MQLPTQLSIPKVIHLCYTAVFVGIYQRFALVSATRQLKPGTEAVQLPAEAPPPPRKSSRSHGVIPRSKSEKLWMIPISPCDPNVMMFNQLVSKLWARPWQAKMAQLLTIGSHIECAIQTELVVELELALIERKQSH